MIRHFCSTGFVVQDSAVLVHWHKKVGAWLPPGGHIEANEDPVQATLREVKEETGIEVRVVPTVRPLDIENLDQVAAPHSIMLEDVVDAAHGPHQHIDFIYFTVPQGTVPKLQQGWVWVSEIELAGATPMLSPLGNMAPPPEDVIKLGLAAIAHVRDQAEA